MQRGFFITGNLVHYQVLFHFDSAFHYKGIRELSLNFFKCFIGLKFGSKISNQYHKVWLLIIFIRVVFFECTSEFGSNGFGFVTIHTKVNFDAVAVLFSVGKPVVFGFFFHQLIHFALSGIGFLRK